MSGALAGRRAIVTGGSRGLGLEIARAFWREGASLLLVARERVALDDALARLEAERRDPTQRLHVLAADLGDPAAPAVIAAHAEEALGGVDVLVNNAGLIGPIGTLAETDAATWDRTLRVNLLAPVALSRCVVPAMVARGDGRIVNVSGGGATTALPHFSAYATSKAGLVRFTETLARELDGSGVTVNALSPGALDTRLHAEVRAAGPALAGDAMYRTSLDVRNGRAAPMERGAALAVFLASAASGGVSGRLISSVWDPWERLPELAGELAASDVYTLRRITPKERGKDWDGA